MITVWNALGFENLLGGLTNVLSQNGISDLDLECTVVRTSKEYNSMGFLPALDGLQIVHVLSTTLIASETALGAIEDAGRYPDLFIIRRALLDWRFYHGFRTDIAAPLRQPCLAVATPTLSSDASDLAAVLATLVHIRQDTTALSRAIDGAFPGAELVQGNETGQPVGEERAHQRQITERAVGELARLEDALGMARGRPRRAGLRRRARRPRVPAARAASSSGRGGETPASLF